MVQFGEHATEVLEKRYLLKDKAGNFTESANDMFSRVASAIAVAENKFPNSGNAPYWEDKFYNIMANLDFLPNSPTLMNAGTRAGQLSACFVLPVKDNMKSIFNTLRDTALIQQSGGGTGFNFSQLRPAGNYVDLTGGEASGPVSFMKLYDAATHYVKQGGKRRGANMGILNIDHPDIQTFIRSKNEASTLTNFNISVGVSDAFMKTLKVNGEWELKHICAANRLKKIPAKELWNEIILSAWKTGDPGLIFLDRINDKNPTPALGEILATNPCGEVPLLPYEACNLGSLNLRNMLVARDGKFDIDWDKISGTIQVAIRFLDNVIEVNNYIIPETRAIVLGNRKVGLGVMGWAEMLILLKLAYDSEEAVRLGEKLMQFINDKSREASILLAKERGPFPNWEKSIYFPDTPVRNATRTSIAPTGTISIIAGTSSSIEPLFALVFRRMHILDEAEQLVINPLFKESIAEITNTNLNESELDIDEASLLKMLPAEMQKIFVTAFSVPFEYHLKHQVAFQKYTDNAVSKTINLPESATMEDVEKIYREAWEQDLKGITIYRNHSKESQVLNTRESRSGIPYVSSEISGSCKVCRE